MNALDPENPVVKLCAAGMAAEAEGRNDDAARLFVQAWEVRTDPFEGCIAAHHVARHQASAEDSLGWNRTALELALQVGDERVRGFHSSLHLSVGYSLEQLGDLAGARRHYLLAEAALDQVPPGAYGGVVLEGVRRALVRVGASASGP